MDLQNSKKYAMAIASIQILVFHLWIPLLPYYSLAGQAERFLVAATYMGVDIFFFVSAYSMVKRPVEDYGEFIRNRAIKILPLFAVAYILGQFLWFLPSIMAVYLLFPPIYQVCKNKPALWFPILFAAWGLVTWLLLSFVDEKQALGIFLFRIPSVLLGAYAVSLDGKFSDGQKLIYGMLLSFVGVLLVYNYGYMDKLSVPFKDAFYLTGIPLMLGMLLLIDYAAAHIKIKPLERLGSITLELYFTQVVLGSFLINKMLVLSGSRMLTNITSFTIVIAASALIYAVNNAFIYRFNKQAKLS